MMVKENVDLNHKSFRQIYRIIFVYGVSLIVNKTIYLIKRTLKRKEINLPSTPKKKKEE